MIYDPIDDDDETTVAAPMPGVSAEAFKAFTATSALAAQLVRLEEHFEQTATYRRFQKRVFDILAAREARMGKGKGELKGAMLIGPAGAGKSRIVEEIIKEHHALTQHVGNWQYGTRILSVVVPGRSTLKETLNAILKALGHPARGRRDEEYLASLVTTYLKLCGVAAVHLDEVQDSGRYKTKDSTDPFLKVFRNLMQAKDWPVCLIMTATPEATDILNGDKTFLRRMKPMEMRPMTFASDGEVLRDALRQLFEDAGLEGSGILSQDEFIKILIHASAGRFGVAVEMSIEAIGACLGEESAEIDMAHFADAYEMRMDCDEELNPFVSVNWKLIDTMNALQRYEEERQVKRRRKT
ncbi:ATP-binding protein [Sulfitobacter sp. 1A12157]|uniref:ATP-binding protein n=1 Tax=Sulfitobacter sp. 1A12157 TaxID=3368594 RepID=UPI003746BB38